MENTNDTCVTSNLCDKEIYCKMQQRELKNEKEKAIKKHNHQSKRQRDTLNKPFSNSEHSQNLERSNDMETGEKTPRSNEQIKIKFCSRHGIETINQHSIKTNAFPKELLESIQKLPNEINAILSDSSHNKEEREKNISKTGEMDKNDHKLVTRKNKMTKHKRKKNSEQIISGSSEIESIKDKKTRISTYFHSLISKPQVELSGIPPKSKSYSNSKVKKSKSTRKCNVSRSHGKNFLPVRGSSSKHNLRANYIQWLLAENKFFSKIDSTPSIEDNIDKTQGKSTPTVISHVFDGKPIKEEQKKRSKKHRKENKNSGIAGQNGKLIETKSSPNNTSRSAKNSEEIFNEIMSNTNFSSDQLRHIRWLASVENIIRIKSKELVRRTISLNELYSYIPTRDVDNIENLLQPNNKELCLKKAKHELNHIRLEHLKNKQKPLETCQTQLYTSNDFAQMLRLSPVNNDKYEPTCEVKESTESVETLSIAIKTTNNISDSCGSLNIEIFQKTEDLCSNGQLKQYNDAILRCNESNVHTNTMYCDEYSYRDNEEQYKQNLSCPLIKTPTNVLVNPPPIYFSSTDYDHISVYNSNLKQIPAGRQNATGSFYNHSESNSYATGTVTYSNDYIYGDVGGKNNPWLLCGKHEHLNNSSFMQVTSGTSSSNNSTTDPVTNKTDDFSHLISSTRSNLFENNNCCHQPEEYNIQFVYEDKNNNENQIFENEDYTERINKFVPNIKYNDNWSRKTTPKQQKYIPQNDEEKMFPKPKQCGFKYLVNKGERECSNLESNIYYPISRGKAKRMKSVKNINSQAIQCDIQSSPSTCSNTISLINRKRKYNANDEDDNNKNDDYDNEGSTDFGAVYKNVCENTEENIMTSCKSNTNSCQSACDKKQNEILLVMSELTQKVNLIQEQISFMQINYNKCENIEAMLNKLKTDVVSNLKRVQFKLTDIEHDQKKTEMLEQKNETDMIIKTENTNIQSKITGSNAIINPSKIFNKEDQSDCCKVSGKDHKLFCDALVNLTNKLDLLTPKEGTPDEKCLQKPVSDFKDVGLMTDKSLALCNNCSVHDTKIKLKPIKSCLEKEIQCDLNYELNNSTNQETEIMSTECTQNKNECNSMSKGKSEVRTNSKLNEMGKKPIKGDKSTPTYKTKHKNSRGTKNKQCYIF